MDPVHLLRKVSANFRRDGVPAWLSSVLPAYFGFCSRYCLELKCQQILFSLKEIRLCSGVSDF